MYNYFRNSLERRCSMEKYDETKREKFIRLAEARTNKIIDMAHIYKSRNFLMVWI